MKYLRRVVGATIGLLLLLGILIILIHTLETQTTPFETNLTFQSPLEPATPTAISTPTPTRVLPPLGLPSPTPSPTITPIGFVPSATPTWPPPPPTRTPSPTFTPAPPTPTPEPLPTLIPGFDTLVYATTGERKPELYRVQVNEAGRVTGNTYRIESIDSLPPSGGGNAHTGILGLYPSPDGQHIAVEWTHGTGMYVSILDVYTGQFKHLYPEVGVVRYLSWAPDGKRILTLSMDGYYETKPGGWLVDIQTGEKVFIDVSRSPISASFSPDGKHIVYAQLNDKGSGSEIWRITLDGSDRHFLYEIPNFRIEDVRWSPDGAYIAFTQSPRPAISERPYGYAMGELWVMTPEGHDRQLLHQALIGIGNKLAPVWSSNSQYLAFVMHSTNTLDQELNYVPGNIYLADIQTASIKKMTDWEGRTVQKPVWSTDGSQLISVVNLIDISNLFEPVAITIDSDELNPLSESNNLIIRHDHSGVPFFIWLPTSQRGGK